MHGAPILCFNPLNREIFFIVTHQTSSATSEVFRGRKWLLDCRKKTPSKPERPTQSLSGYFYSNKWQTLYFLSIIPFHPTSVESKIQLVQYFDTKSVLVDLHTFWVLCATKLTQKSCLWRQKNQYNECMNLVHLVNIIIPFDMTREKCAGDFTL